MLERISSRQVFLAIALVCAAAMAYAYYAEYVLKLEPCPLCMFQRFAMILLGAISVIAALHGPQRSGIRVYAVLGFVAAGLGAAIAGRHVWLQSLPKDQLPSCAPPLDYMWDNLPFGDVLRTVMMTSGECANIDWQFLGLSMPVWTLICFGLLGLTLLWVLVFPRVPLRAGSLDRGYTR